MITASFFVLLEHFNFEMFRCLLTQTPAVTSVY